MTNYRAWDSKADALCREVEEEDRKEQAANNEALGLTDGPKGPPTEKAEKEVEQLKDHSQKRNEFIDWCKDREVSVSHTSHTSPSEEVELSVEEFKRKAVRIKNSTGVTYVVPEGAELIKLMLDNCSNVKVHVRSSLITSTAELYKCSNLELTLDHPLGTVQVDECPESVLVKFAERDHVGKFYHQNSPGLSVSWGLSGPAAAQTVGRAGAFQLLTRVAGDSLRTEPVRRGEGEFPLDFVQNGAAPQEQPEPEAAPAAEQRRQEAEKHRLAGNDMFRAADFAQAAALYSLAVEKAPDLASAWANRAQCWLKLGQPEKALADAKRCTEVEPTNPKGWFRQGMSLHAMKRYPEAIAPLLEAEKLEPTNKQVVEAIKMAQLMARKSAGF
mmetsp:Transcript_8496/g.20140  ORF Transcript_8496/g.20140 Transcript_8496/m.20140 type:complete len:386 (+) Transcript_8496:52-1209(+)